MSGSRSLERLCESSPARVYERLRVAHGHNVAQEQPNGYPALISSLLKNDLFGHVANASGRRNYYSASQVNIQ